MQKINRLDGKIVAKIAAGEVVERPVSVVKELVENSIDSNADEIKITIFSSGKKEIRITDNGQGIQKDDLPLLFERYATSKIITEEDLYNIATMGFRGEALASIASISRVSVTSRTKETSVGYQINSEDSKITQVSHPLGTSVIVKDLFYNTPARKKYLKSDATEFSHISDLIQRYALSFPNISFFLYKEKQPFLKVPNGIDEISRISYIYGNLIAKNLCDVSFENEFIKIKGFAGKPTIARESNDYISIFVNGRYVKSDLINSSIIDSYKSMLFLKRKPIVILKITLDPKRIDVNVHPSKLVVKFDNEQLVYYSVYEAIKKTLKENNLIESQEIKKPNYSPFLNKDKSYPSADENRTIRNDELTKSQDKFYTNEKETKYSLNQSKLTTLKNEKFMKKDFSSLDLKENEIIATKTGSKDENTQINVLYGKDKLIFRILGQVNKTYIVAQTSKGLALIDQHAACERINFEKIEKEYNSGLISSQVLLKPFLIFLNQKYKEVLKEKKNYFKKIGFEIEEFGENEVIIRSIPLILGKEMDENQTNILVEELAQNFLDKSIADLIDQRILYTIACKKSIKAGEELSFVQMNNILKELFECVNPFTCPHGRPTIIEFDEENLEKLFKRRA
ncbi:MAG TPA: DNA mismatch repair endonuclease MutL [Candidatus Woesearchaeota archaeon]|nr:DNA mismatch repair endonuclease MutL [Candidatus Woesearchaeota archaeon]